MRKIYILLALLIYCYGVSQKNLVMLDWPKKPSINETVAAPTSHILSAELRVYDIAKKMSFPLAPRDADHSSLHSTTPITVAQFNNLITSLQKYNLSPVTLVLFPAEGDGLLHIDEMRF